MDEDRQLVERFIDGDDAALEELVVRYQRRIYGYSYRITQNIEDAKDLTQKVFMNVVSSIREFRKEASFRTWLYRIATNACLNHLRQRREEVEMDESVAASQAGALSMLIKRQEALKLREALRTLPERQRTAVILRVYEGLSCAETAGVMECSEGAVKAHYHHALKKMKEMFRES